MSIHLAMRPVRRMVQCEGIVSLAMPCYFMALPIGPQEIDGLFGTSVAKLLIAVAGPACHFRLLLSWVKLLQIRRQHLNLTKILFISRFRPQLNIMYQLACMKVKRASVVTLMWAWTSHFKVLHHNFYMISKALLGELPVSCMWKVMSFLLRLVHCKKAAKYYQSE